jgi:coenzyme F420-reducing hydrogenase alpha subunit
MGAAIHAPLPTVGGFFRMPDAAKFPELITRLEEIRPRVLRGIKLFYDWQEEFKRDTDYLCLRNDERWSFFDGRVINSGGKKVEEEEFYNFLTKVVIPYSQAEGYHFSDTHEDYLVGALARVNLNMDQLHERTQQDVEPYLNFFPSDNIHDNNLAQAIEILQCVDEAIDILKSIEIVDEKPIRQPPKVGRGVGVVEAPRGILYHMAEVDGKGIIVDYDVIVPTAQNQINIENDLKQMFTEKLDEFRSQESEFRRTDQLSDEDKQSLKHEAEKIIRAYDPCMSCATNFLEIEWV